MVLLLVAKGAKRLSSWWRTMNCIGEWVVHMECCYLMEELEIEQTNCEAGPGVWWIIAMKTGGDGVVHRDGVDLQRGKMVARSSKQCVVSLPGPGW
jgi:hypothetical protein